MSESHDPHGVLDIARKARMPPGESKGNCVPVKKAARRGDEAADARRRMPRLVAGGAGDGELAPELSEGLLQAVLETGEPLYVAAPDGRVLYANAAYRALAPALTDDVRQALYTADELTTAGSSRLLAREHVVDDGTGPRRYTSAHSVLPGAGGAARGVVGRFTPVDEARPPRRTLAEERLDDVARLASDWLWETDRELRLTFVSARVTEALGYHPRELLGERLPALPVHGGEGLAERLSRRPPPHFRDVEVEMLDRAGERRLFRLAGLPTFCPQGGGVLGYRGTAQDVTELAARERALREAKEAAEDANRAKSRFLANMSHELRTPLNAVIGFSEIMRDEVFGAVGNPRYRGYAADILASARRLLRLIDEVLDVSRIETGTLALEAETIDPARLAASALRSVAEQAERGGIALHAELPEEPVRLRGDAGKLARVLVNLLSNAVKFTGRDGRVRLAAGRLGDGGFQFQVRDDGIGMSETEIEMALSPFVQVDSALARRFQGTGLGLPLARALAELHGGSLQVESVPGAGTTVTVRLPPDRVLSP